MLKLTRNRAGLTGFGQLNRQTLPNLKQPPDPGTAQIGDAQLGVEAAHEALYRAYFINNINVGDVEEMLLIEAALDLDVEAAHNFL